MIENFLNMWSINPRRRSKTQIVGAALVACSLAVSSSCFAQAETTGQSSKRQESVKIQSIDPLFVSTLQMRAETLNDAQATQLAIYAADRKVAEISLVQLRSDLARRSEGVLLNLPASDSVRLSNVRVEERSARDYSWFAQDDSGQSEVILVFRDDNVVGTIKKGEQLYQVRPLPNGVSALLRIDTKKMPPEHPPGFKALQQQALERPASPEGRPISPAADTGAEYTAIVAYTAGAQSYAGDIDALIQLAEDETNQGYLNSGVNTRIRIVRKYKTGYVESGSMSTDLTRYRTIGDGYADEVHTQRDTYAADVAILLTDGFDYCGIAYLYPDQSAAFGVVAASCATGYYSFAHEIGHIQGARHNPEIDGSTSPFAYGHGYQYPAGGWRTIMAYDCASSCTRINRWSNPYLTYGGTPTGTVAVSYNARVLNETAVRVANFRVGAPTPSWRSWESVTGVGVVGRPDCIATGTNQIDCFVNTPGFKVSWNRWNSSGWRGWNDLGGVISSALSCLTRGTRLHCFAIGADNRLQQNIYDGTGWTGWISRSNSGLSTQRPACVGLGTAAIRCLAVNATGKLIDHAYTGSAWLKPVDLGGTVQGRPFCLNRSGGLDCFALFKTKRINWRRFNGSSWAAWKVVGASNLATSPSCVLTGTTLQCFAEGGSTTGPMMTSKLTGSQWSAWTSLGGALKEQPSCLAFGAKGIECFAQSSGNTLWRKSFGGTVWAAAQDLGGSIASRPNCVSAAAGRIDCIAPGTDGVLKRIAYY